MTRITVDVNDEWLETAREILGTDTKGATINEALHKFALQKKAAEIMALLDSVELDLAGSENDWRYGGDRDLSRLEENAREAEVA